MARCQMKRAVKECDSLYRLLSEEEKAGLVTEADLLAEKTFYRADGSALAASTEVINPSFSPTDMAYSWVVWALEQVRFLPDAAPSLRRQLRTHAMHCTTRTGGRPPLPRRLVRPQPPRVRAARA